MLRRQSRKAGGMMFSASARICAIRSLRISGGGTENSCWRPLLVDAHLLAGLRVADPVPDEIVAPVAGPQVVVESGDRIADDLLALRQEEHEIGKDAAQRFRREIGLVRRAAPDVVARVDRLHLRRDLRAHAGADAVAADQQVGAFDAALGEMDADAVGRPARRARRCDRDGSAPGSMVSRSSRCSRSQEVRICRNGRSPMTRPSRSMVMRLCTSMPRSRVPAPLFSSASSNSGWVVMPAPRPTSSTGERSNTSTSQPIRRRNAAVNRPDIEPPTMTARRRRRCDENAMSAPDWTPEC